jgi:ketosteroid isomerase-like protein
VSREAEAEVAEIVAWHHRWRQANAAKDIDAVTALIAPSIIAYEYLPPHQLSDRGEIRDEYAARFETDHEVDWSVPDLHVMVRGDIAIAWGLIRMATRSGIEPMTETWFRSTRALQKVDGRWLAVHQHASFPVDPITGAAVTDLTF